jgi:hypothetical protein
MTTQRHRRKRNPAPLVIAVEPPRNTVVRALAQRAGSGAGSHEKRSSAKRRAAKVALQRELRQS